MCTRKVRAERKQKLRAFQHHPRGEAPQHHTGIARKREFKRKGALAQACSCNSTDMQAKGAHGLFDTGAAGGAVRYWAGLQGSLAPPDNLCHDKTCEVKTRMVATNITCTFDGGAFS